MTKPNIIFIFSDQQRWDTLGCYGQPLDITPNIDKIASEGVRFENTFTCQPVCGPARACLQTGKYATETGCFRNEIALGLNERTLGHRFSDTGYEVGYIGKWHLASTTSCNYAIDDNGQLYLQSDRLEDGSAMIDYRDAPIPLERRGGWKDYWLASDMLENTSHGYDGYLFDADMNKVEFTGYRVDAMTDFALDYLKSRELLKPFFLFLSFIEPHHQNDHNCYEGPSGSKEKYKDFVVPKDLEGLEGNWQKEYPDYLGCCASLDKNVGRIKAELEKLGLSENTILIYTSDHGSHFKTRNAEYKRSCHDSSIRVPLIISGPGFKGGKVIKELVSLIDLPPTLLACADIDKPESMQGEPIQRLVSGDIDDWQKEVFVQISESHVARAIRTDRWKYCVAAYDKDPLKESSSEIYEEQFLYDLSKDPHERNNLVKLTEYKNVCEKLRKILIKRMVEAGEDVPQIKPAV